MHCNPQPRHEQGKEAAPQNAQKQQKNRAKTKARKRATKTASLFVVAKTLQSPKKCNENAKCQQ